MPLFLIGFMAAGKTSVGRALAAAAGRRFVDLDDLIAAQGEPVAQLVARDEPELRRREAAALRDAIADAGDNPVIATGGGAAVFGDNLERMRAAGCVVALGVDLAEAERRAAGGPPRPLLATPGLAAARAPVYRRAHAVVETTGRTVAEVVAQVAAVERAWRPDATIVALGERSYPITIGAFDPAAVGKASRIAIVTDENVARYHAAPIATALGVTDVLAIPAGEASKSFAMYQRVSEALVASGLDRGSLIVALGGGVVGDLAGFVAATLFRGIPIVHLPTTLVAMTDSAIGGKTAIDLAAGKNLVGAFWQPRLVACDLATLATLPVRERRAGFGELWKYALLDGAAMVAAVDACAGWAAGDAKAPPELVDVIRRAIAFKAAIVGRDEREQTGHRALLNLGHTVGHAIESAAGGSLLHGEAIALGLVAACRVSAALGHPDHSGELVAALGRAGLPTDLSPWLTDDVLGRLAVDKKRVGTTLKFIVVREVGQCQPTEIAITELVRILRSSPSS